MELNGKRFLAWSSVGERLASPAATLALLMLVAFLYMQPLGLYYSIALLVPLAAVLYSPMGLWKPRIEPFIVGLCGGLLFYGIRFSLASSTALLQLLRGSPLTA